MYSNDYVFKLKLETMFRILKQFFCNHEWHIEEIYEEEINVDGMLSVGDAIKYRVCKKCGKKIKI